MLKNPCLFSSRNSIHSSYALSEVNNVSLLLIHIHHAIIQMAIIRPRRPVHERPAGFDCAHLALPVVVFFSFDEKVRQFAFFY